MEASATAGDNGDTSVSVIIPAFNAENSLGHAVESVLSQTHPPLEIIVIDDGSTDRTGQVAGSYADRIVCLRQANRGQGAARNAGLGVARGTMIAFLDADDYWKPGFLQACLDFLAAHRQAIAVSTGLIVRRLDGSEVVLPECFCGDAAARQPPFMIDDFFEFWARFDHVRTGSNLIRHAVIREAGFQRDDLRIAQDLEYWGYLATYGKWGFIPEPLWVGNSRQAARQKGWLTRYEQRRRLCPDVGQWGRRIEPRLRPHEHGNYRIVKGRIALAYAQNKILAGAREPACEIVREYGSTMPSCRLTQLMRTGARLGPWGWRLACGMICLKERAKALRMQLRWRNGVVREP